MSKPIAVDDKSCTYKPPLLCIRKKSYNDKYRNHAMKVMKNTKHVWDEVEIGRIIDIFDPNHQYFITLNGDWCTVDRNDVSTTSCGIFDTDPRGYFMEYQGTPLNVALAGNMVMLSVDELISWTKHIMTGLNFLHEIGICHMNIDDHSLILSDGISKLMNFSKSLFTDNVQINKIPQVGVLYPIWVSQLSYGERINTTYLVYEDMLAKYFTKIVKYSANDPVLRYFNNHRRLQYVNNDYIREVIAPNITKVDTYMWGQLMLNMLKRISHDEQWKVFYQLCINCINPMVEQQYDTKQILEYIDHQGW